MGPSELQALKLTLYNGPSELQVLRPALCNGSITVALSLLYLKISADPNSCKVVRFSA